MAEKKKRPIADEGHRIPAPFPTQIRSEGQWAKLKEINSEDGWNS